MANGKLSRPNFQWKAQKSDTKLHLGRFLASGSLDSRDEFCQKNLFRAGFEYVIFVLDAIFEADLTKKNSHLNNRQARPSCKCALPKVCVFAQVRSVESAKEAGKTFRALPINIDCGYVLLLSSNAPRVAVPCSWPD